MSTSPAARLMELFAGHPAAHGTHGEPNYDAAKNKWEIKQTASTKKDKVTVELWERHIAGTYPLGIITIKPNSTVQWGCIDIDEYQDDLLHLISQIEVHNYPLVPCRSKSGGLHLFLFLTSPAPAIAVITFLRDVAAHLGHATAEIFPKQAQIHADRGEIGNWIVMPYFGGTFGGKLREQTGLKKTGAEQTLDEFLIAAEAARVTPNQLAELTQPPAHVNGAGTKSPRPSRPTFSNGPPCLQIMVERGWSNHRNDTLLHAGRYAKLAHPNDWKAEVSRYNAEYCKPPLPPEEVMGVIRSLEKKNYEYLCKYEPMASHCNAALCRSRKFGIGTEGNYPRISSISKVNRELVTWFVEVDDMHLELSTEQLQRYDLFHRMAMEQGTCYRAMKQDAWFQTLREAMENLTISPYDSPDIGEPEIFREHLEDYLTNRQRGRQMDDVLSGRPWEDEETHRHYFRLKGLMAYLKRIGDRTGRTKVSLRLRALGGGEQFLYPKGEKTRCWYVPSACVAPTPTPDPPPVPSAPI